MYSDHGLVSDTQTQPRVEPILSTALPRLVGIEHEKDAVSYLGVKLQKGTGGLYVPDADRFKNHALTEFDLTFAKNIAIAWDLGHPLLIEGGTGLGKSDLIEMMCAQLDWESYYVNCHDFEPEVVIGRTMTVNDPKSKSGFGWVDGLALKAVHRGPEGARKVLVLDEYNFMNPDTRAALHQILDAVLNGKKRIIIPGRGNDVIEVDPNTRIVAIQNPPDLKHTDREILDSPQLTRFTYLRLPGEFPKELKIARVAGMTNPGAVVNTPRDLFLFPSPDFSLAKLKEHPDFSDFAQKFIDFSESVEKLTEARRIGKGQAQPVYFSFQRDFRRVCDFIARYYDGDLYGTAQKALQYYYENRFEAAADRGQVRELVERIEGEGISPSKRRSLEGELAEPPPSEGVIEARMATAALPQEKIYAQAAPPKVTRPAQTLTPDEEFQYQTLEELEHLYKRGASPRSLIAGLTMLTIEPAWEWRNWYLSTVTAAADRLIVAESLAGINSDLSRNWKRTMTKEWLTLPVDKKLETGSYICRAFSGDNTGEAWVLRIEGAKTPQTNEPRPFDKFAGDKNFMMGLVGLKGETAEQHRNARLESGGERIQYTLASYGGDNSDRAWEVRENALRRSENFFQRKNRSHLLTGVAESLTMLEGERADQMRTHLEQNGATLEDRVNSLKGIGTPGSIAERRELLERGAPAYLIAWSLTGVRTPEAQELREQLREQLLGAGGSQMDWYCRGLYADYRTAGILAGQGRRTVI